ncbi:MAG: hypothetical protein K2N08_09055 [Muribaculaceae bacterium]|nr:hypothetical protein [Muribaculaceae bacterium]
MRRPQRAERANSTVLTQSFYNQNAGDGELFGLCYKMIFQTKTELVRIAVGRKPLKLMKSFVFYILLALLTSSCANNKSNPEDRSSENTNPITSPFGNFHFMPVRAIKSSDVSSSKMNFVVILVDENGNALNFDNDMDYTIACPLYYFITKVSSNLGYDRVNNYGETYTEDEERKYLNDFQTMVTGVFDYLNGNKDKITDRKLFKAIDKAYYDYHPEEAIFYELDSKYGSKKYGSDRLEGNNVTEHIKVFCTENSYCTYGDRQPIPEDIMIMRIGTTSAYGMSSWEFPF